ncbi:hypothetical protein FIBSPDRAFT_860664 [Athelia psychrophila]|uniref:Uncharacterized protein n=1 Tax=Athelia psychrophila TaxID=1759441 RepID=A0A166K331_9AGAM|nr:hypothetical protein FIBSPDRAFT_860664 [Fibularhizoctonia sp. CBS 109695]
MSCSRNSPSHQTIHIAPRLIHPGNPPSPCNFDNMLTGATMIRRSVQVSTLADPCWPGTCDVGRVGGCGFRMPLAASCAPRPPPAPAPTPRSASVPAATSAPMPTLHSLLNLHPEGIRPLSVHRKRSYSRTTSTRA